MHSETIEAIRRSAAIPSMPLVATRCYEITQDPECNYDRLVELLSTDPGIAAEVLRLSNSSLFGVSRQVTSLKQAIALLGLKRLRDLVLTRYLVQRVDETRGGPIDIDYFWRRSISAAVIGSRLAEAALPRRRDEAFLAGLLSDIGVIVLAKALPSKYQPIAVQYKPLGGEGWIEQERGTLDLTHADVSAMVLEEWSLPESIVDGVRYSHSSEEEIPVDSPGAKVARLTNAASTIARALCEAQNPAVAAGSCIAAAEVAGLSAAVLADVLPHIEADVATMATMLNVEIVSGKVFGLIAQQIVVNLTAPSA